MSRIGILGGTFNPPHNGHIHAARQAVETLRLDEMLLMPDNIPPHKTMPTGSATGAQRLEMARLAAEEIPRARAIDIELRRGGRSYTVDTMRRLRQALPDDTLYLLMGTDMLLTLEQWREPQALCQLVRLAVVARDARDREAIARKALLLRETWRAEIDVIDCPALPVSSTNLRADRALCRRMTPDSVFAYIQREKLYF